MARYYVAYTRNICYKYKANLRSNVTIFLFFINLFCFILPFILSYNSKGFWIKQYSFREQPMIRFKYQFILILEHKTTEFFSNSIICTTYSQMDPRTTFSDNCSLVKVVEKDENNDGKKDGLNLLMHVTNISNVDVTALHLFLIFDYKIFTECILDMEIMTIASQVFSQPIGKINLISDLVTNIKEPLGCNMRYSRKHNSSTIAQMFDQSDKFNFMQKLLSSYSSRLVNVGLTNTHYTAKLKTEVAENEPFEITADVQYTEQIITYKTKFWQLIKWAWIQYFSLVALFFFISRKIKKFVFQNRVLQTIRTQPSDE